MKFITFLAALTVAASAAYSQAEREVLKTMAIFYNFNGTSSVGGKIWISEQSALTLSVGGSAASSMREAADTSYLDEEHINSSITLVVGVEQHLDLGWEVSPYLTGGLSVGHSRYANNYGTTTSQYESESLNTSVGMRAGFGVEYWFTRRISLAGQQLVTANYGLGKYSSGLAGSPSQDSRSFDLGLGTSALILSVYL